MWWLVRWNSDLKVDGSRSSHCHRAVSLDKKRYPTLSLSTQKYKWVVGDMTRKVGLLVLA